MMGGLTVEQIGDAMDAFLKENRIQMLIEMPEGTLDVETRDNTDCGPIMQFYILLNTIGPVAERMRQQTDIDGKSEEWAKCVDGLLELVRNEILEGESNGDGDVQETAETAG